MEKGSDPLKSSDPLNPHGHDVYGLIPLSLSHIVVNVDHVVDLMSQRDLHGREDGSIALENDVCGVECDRH